MSSLKVFAVRGDPLKFVELLPWLCMAVFAIGGLVAAMYFLRFLRHWKVGDANDEASLRSQFRELHQRGELSQAEYREIQISLAEQMRRRVEEEEAAGK